MSRPCVFFDRDGVVNVSPGPGYVLRPEDFHLQAGITDCLKIAHERGYVTVLVTSQRCVGKGLISEDGLAAIHSKMQAELGGGFRDIFAFTGLPGTETWEKPSPVMIQLAAEKHDIDLENSWMIGDADRDIEMAHRARIKRTIRVTGEREVTIPAEFETDSIPGVAEILKNNL